MVNLVLLPYTVHKFIPYSIIPTRRARSPDRFPILPRKMPPWWPKPSVDPCTPLMYWELVRLAVVCGPKLDRFWRRSVASKYKSMPPGERATQPCPDLLPWGGASSYCSTNYYQAEGEKSTKGQLASPNNFAGMTESTCIYVVLIDIYQHQHRLWLHF